MKPWIHPGNREIVGDILRMIELLEEVKMSRIPDFIESLEKMKEIHIKKNEDYATEQNPFSNFEFQEDVVSAFKRDRDKVYASLVAVKIARLATLLNSDKEPNNESIDDSFLDAANYLLLWKAHIKRMQEVQDRIEHLGAAEAGQAKTKKEFTAFRDPISVDIDGKLIGYWVLDKDGYSYFKEIHPPLEIKKHDMFYVENNILYVNNKAHVFINEIQGNNANT